MEVEVKVEVEVEVEVVTAVERAGGTISVPLLQLEHLFLDSVNERVEVVDLGHELRHLHLLVLDRGHRLVGLGAQRVARVEAIAALQVLLREGCGGGGGRNEERSWCDDRW